MKPHFFHHPRNDPWREAPPWALELFAMMELLLLKENKIMTIQDDLVAAVATLTTNIAAHDVAVQAEIKALQDAIAAGDTTATQTAITNIAAASKTIADETAALAASLPTPAAPAP